ncbi:MAG TPA: YsnF/AvaK domain-containing protein [Streptosporangiaceae bacterium]|nr:YsnF/AvaK domain-containing protein [Streptosporangiaceae bacterium]
MTMHADQLVGAPVADSDGLAVGTVEQVFRDDVDGTPSWARIRSAKGFHFVPLTGSKMTRSGGLCIPFDSRRILGEPSISVDRHMSVDQEEQLRRYFGIRVPARPARAKGQAGPAQAGPAQAGQAQAGREEAGGEWMIRSEERVNVNLETRESRRVRVRKYVDSVQVRQIVRVFREELEIERIPIRDDDQVTGDMAEYEQEIVLHEAHATITKETVPVERVRLSVRKVEEDKTVDCEILKERIEIVHDESSHRPPEP